MLLVDETFLNDGYIFITRFSLVSKQSIKFITVIEKPYPLKSRLGAIAARFSLGSGCI